MNNKIFLQISNKNKRLFRSSTVHIRVQRERVARYESGMNTHWLVLLQDSFSFSMLVPCVFTWLAPTLAICSTVLLWAFAYIAFIHQHYPCPNFREDPFGHFASMHPGLRSSGNRTCRANCAARIQFATTWKRYYTFQAVYILRNT